MQKAIGRLRTAYESAENASRHTTKIADRKVIVTEWEDLPREVGRIMQKISS